jgi:ribosomal protein S18 acetylase RimI-like enzyme
MIIEKGHSRTIQNCVERNAAVPLPITEKERKMKTATELDLELIHLPEGFAARPPRMDEVEVCVKLFNRWSQAVLGRDEIADGEAIRTEWVSPGFDPQTDIRLVITPDGTLAGYVEVWTTANPSVHPWIWMRVHPEYQKQGVEKFLMNWGEQRALQVLPNLPADLRFAPRIGAYKEAAAFKDLFVLTGYTRIRSSYRMRIDLGAPPPVPVWPDGISLRPYNPETDAEAVYRADVDSFRDHFGFIWEPFEEGFKRFKHFLLDYSGFDPSIQYLAMDGDEIAGICLCRAHSFDDPNQGWVSTLGVRRQWRKRGIGLALLRHAFGEFHRRGARSAGLGVDAENLTGALRLYEKAGMHIYSQFDLYEKEIRPGREISVQSLES